MIDTITKVDENILLRTKQVKEFINKEHLEREREQLQARIDEIDTLLTNFN